MRKIYIGRCYNEGPTEKEPEHFDMTRGEVEAMLRARVKKSEKKAKAAREALDAFYAAGLEG